MLHRGRRRQSSIGKISAESDLRVISLRQEYLIALPAGLQRRESPGEILRLSFKLSLEANSANKKGQTRVCPLRSDGRNLLRRVVRERFLQFSVKFFLPGLAIIFLAASQDLDGRRKLFSDPRQSLGYSSDLLHQQRGAQWRVLSSKPSLSKTVPP